jgi:hypothetical protein
MVCNALHLAGGDQKGGAAHGVTNVAQIAIASHVLYLAIVKGE